MSTTPAEQTEKLETTATEIIENMAQEKVQPEEAIEKLEAAIRESGNGEILDMVKKNQELFEIANNLLFRAVALSAELNTDVFLISANNGVLFLTEADYTKTLENSEEDVKVQIKQHFPDAPINVIEEKYDEYVSNITLKYVNKDEAKKYVSAIKNQFGTSQKAVSEEAK
jgi:BMFP domain-containing protein YqiC